MTGRLDEEEAAVNAGILDVTLSLSGELLAEVRRVLVLDVLDDWVPASIVVYLVAVTRGIDNVQAESHAVLFDNVRDGLNLGRGADRLIWGEATLRIDEVGCEDGVDESGLSETGLT